MPKKRSDGRYEKTATINGKVRHFYGRTLREVNEKIRKAKTEQERGIRFDRLADEYLTEYIEEHPSSRRAVEANVNRLVEFFGRSYAKDITAKDITSFLFSLELGQKTVSNCKSVMKCIYDFGILNHDLADNPAIARRVPRGLPKKEREMPTPEELQIIRTRTDAPNALMFLIRLYTGLRRGEILALKYRDIDRENKLLTVSKSVYHDANHPNIKEPKTEKGKRQVLLPDALLELLPDGKKTDFIFGGAKPLTRHQVQRRIEAYQKATGLSVGLHQLRHRYRTFLYEAGVDERMRMSLLGHADISTTRNIYTHITESRRDGALEQLNSYFLKKSSES